MVLSRDRQIEKLERKLEESKRLNKQQGDKVLELLEAQSIIDGAGLMFVGEEFCGCRLCD